MLPLQSIQLQRSAEETSTYANINWMPPGSYCASLKKLLKTKVSLEHHHLCGYFTSQEKRSRAMEVRVIDRPQLVM